ncbi:MAG TPA: dockerin type I repeat-containing protein [candidate division Zixibacteria bacterium]|nr:dockerin type I repeat-containing protein [candidate division Zixibacteria bacterium]
MKKAFVSLLVLMAVVCLSGRLNGSSVTIDYVNGLFLGDTIACQGTMFLRYTNDRDYAISGIDNAYRIWTVNGTPLDVANLDTLSVDFGGGAGWTDAFDNIFDIYERRSSPSACTLGFGGVRGTSQGLPAGFNQVVAKIDVRFFSADETLCIDSSWCAPNHPWMWAADNGNPSERPAWGGPYCFHSTILSCGYPFLSNCPDTIRAALSDLTVPVSYDFHADPFQAPPSEVIYELLYGPGSMDSLTGHWETYIPFAEIGSPIPVAIGAWETWCTPCNITRCSPTLLVYILGDINIDGTSDIGDLIFLADNMFSDGEPPQVIELADVNGDGALDISDLIYLVDYMFGDGPPPVNPWP